MSEPASPLDGRALSRRVIVIEIVLALVAIDFMNNAGALWRLIAYAHRTGRWLGNTALDREQFSEEELFVELVRYMFYFPAYLLVLYFMYRSGRSFAEYGLTKPRSGEELAADWLRGLILGVISVSIVVALRSVLFPLAQYGHLGSGIQWPALVRYWGDRTLLQYGLIFILAALVGLAEELVFRSYLIPRLMHCGCQARWAVVLSAFLFGIGHLYQGLEGFITTFILGVLFGDTFLRLGRIWPLMIAHMLLDFASF